MDGRIAATTELALVVAALWFAYYAVPSLVSVADHTVLAAGLAMVLSLVILLALDLNDRFSPLVRMLVRKRTRHSGRGPAN